MMGKDHSRAAPEGNRTLSELMQKGVFPFFQGAPNLNSIAAKARALGMVLRPEFHERMQRIKADASALAACLIDKGYHVITGGSDNHLVVIDVIANGITGLVAEKALEDCNIVVNKNRIPGDQKSAFVTSGIRIGTNSLALKGMGPEEMPMCADLVDRVLKSVKPLDDRNYEMDESIKAAIQSEVAEVCRRFPIPCYPQPSEVTKTPGHTYSESMQALAS